jgi:hypothetical protein
VPVPDFPAYRSNPASAPGAELYDLPGVPRLATINMNGANARVPVVYKANASYNRIISDRFRVGLSLFASLGRNNYMYVDRNMADDPYFTLPTEGDRGVFVPAASIPANGVTNWLAGRKTDRVGRVLELVSEGKVNHFAAVLDGTFRYFRDGEITASYTWNDIRDNTSYNGNVANTATLFLMVKDDPRDLSRMTYSDNQFRNKVVFYGTLPTFYGVSVGLRYSGIGGTRYSLRVNGNVNGDFVPPTTWPFVFDPRDESTAKALPKHLDNPTLTKPERNTCAAASARWPNGTGAKMPFSGVGSAPRQTLQDLRQAARRTVGRHLQRSQHVR